MMVRRIALNGWRNYDWETVEFAPDINVVRGRNAQGKTNLLEAVYMLAMGRSFRSRYDRELVGFGLFLRGDTRGRGGGRPRADGADSADARQPQADKRELREEVRGRAGGDDNRRALLPGGPGHSPGGRRRAEAADG